MGSCGPINSPPLRVIVTWEPVTGAPDALNAVGGTKAGVGAAVGTAVGAAVGAAVGTGVGDALACPKMSAATAAMAGPYVQVWEIRPHDSFRLGMKTATDSAKRHSTYSE